MIASQNQEQDPLYMSESDYLAFEEKSDTKHEFVNGRVYAMAGAEWQHVMISQSTSTALYNQLRKKACFVGTSDLRLKVESKKVSYRYPDIMVICGEPNFVDNRKTIDNPTLVIEVLSPSTALVDHNAKLTEYTSLSSVQEYLLISQEEPRIQHYLRQNADKWTYHSITGLENALELPSIGCRLSLADVYEQVSFESKEEKNKENAEGD